MTALSDLITLVDRELENQVQRGSASFDGDGLSSAFLVAPLGGSIIDNATWEVYVDSVATADYVMDYDSGVCVMGTTPTSSQVVSWQFDFKHWSDALVTQAINAAIDNLYPAIYVRSNEVVTAAAEVACPTGTEVVTRVDTGSVGSWTRLRRKRYETIYSGGVPSLRFFSAPTESLRIHYVARPTITTMPDRCNNLVVSYACYYLLSQKMAPRVRSDVAVTTQNSAALLPSQMNYGAQGYMMRYQFQLASMRMPPWGKS
jgi:hypothetical protein